MTMAKSASLALALLAATTAAAAATGPLPHYDDVADADTIFASSSSATTSQPVLCSLELNAYCPPSTTCCPKKKKRAKKKKSSGVVVVGGGLTSSARGNDDDDDVAGYSCLVSWSSRVPQGPCCDDDDDDDGVAFGSGCAAGYTCAAPLLPSSSSFPPLLPFLQNLKIGAKEDDVDDGETESSSSSSSLARGAHCRRDPSAPRIVDDRGRAVNDVEHERMPRYRTCPSFSREDIEAPHGLPIPLAAASYNLKSENAPTITKEVGGGAAQFRAFRMMGRLAYFSDKGPLSTAASPSEGRENIRMAVVGVHGSGRDAGSYLCALTAAVADENASRLFNDKDADDSDGTTVVSKNLRVRRRAAADRKSMGRVPLKPGADEILVVAPWFLAPADGPVQTTIDSSSSSSSSPQRLPFLRWVDDAPISHTFRYGAESVEVPIDDYDDEEGGETTSSTTATVSSYAAMDALLEALCDRDAYPNLERIAVVGHSAGGQFVHRWGLTSKSWCFGDVDDDVPEEDGEEEEEGEVADLPFVRLVAANPRSYTYLDDRRYLPASSDPEAARAAAVGARANDGNKEGTTESETTTLTPFDALKFRRPTTSEEGRCEEYDRYCWGLRENPDLPAPYVAGNIAGEDDDADKGGALFLRYASRDVVYLSGERDVKLLGDQICEEDGYQGPTRRERSERFYASLQVLGEDRLGMCRRGSTEAREEREGWRVKEEGPVVVVGEGSRSENEFCARRGGDGEARVHERMVVRDVGHDHALVFQSPEGLEGIFL